MKLSDQALGAIMMALQKSLLEQSDIVPVLKEMDLQVVRETEDLDLRGDLRVDLMANAAQELKDSVSLYVSNPPVVKLEGTELGDAIAALTEE